MSYFRRRAFRTSRSRGATSQLNRSSIDGSRVPPAALWSGRGVSDSPPSPPLHRQARRRARGRAWPGAEPPRSRPRPPPARQLVGTPARQGVLLADARREGVARCARVPPRVGGGDLRPPLSLAGAPALGTAARAIGGV